jgi:O-antigen/teichoic acid export membrane protein
VTGAASPEQTESTAPERTTGPRPSLARDGGRAIAGSVVSNAGNVLVVLVLARYLGGEAVGEYTIAFAVRAILLLVCGLGMRVTLTRFVAASLARDDAGAVHGSVRAGLAVPLALALVVAAAWYAAAGVLARDVFHVPDLERTLELMALSLPFFVLSDLALAATQGFRTMRAYVWIGQVFEPVTRLGLTLAVVLAGGGVAAAAGALLAASVATALASVVAVVHMLRHVPAAEARTPWRELTSFAGFSWVASMATQGLLWADVVLLGVLVTSEEVGHYQVAARVVLVAMLAVTPLAAAMAPRVAHAWARDDRASVTDRYVDVVRWSSRLSLPLLAGVVAVPAAVLALFGDDFTGAEQVVLLLVLGAVAEAIGAPSSVLLNQIGRNRLNMGLNVSALALNIGLNLALVPRLGISGAAIAWAVTLVTFAAVRVVVVRRVATTRSPITRPVLVAVVAGLLAAAAARAVDPLVPDVDLLRLVVAGVVVLGVYGAVVLARGLDRDEHNSVRRAVALRLPRLRQRRGSWQQRRGTGGTEHLTIDDLVSPFRIDVLARLELFELARRHPDLRRDDPDAFVALARAGLYGAWYDEILTVRGHARGDWQFHQIVTSSLLLLERHDRGVDTGRVSVVRLAAGTDLDGWRLSEDRWVLADGGHRVALALLDGRRTLAPDQHVVVDSLPPNNTAPFLRAGVLPPDEVVRFLARGLTDLSPDRAPTTWTALLAALRVPADADLLRAWPHVEPLRTADDVLA